MFPLYLYEFTPVHAFMARHVFRMDIPDADYSAMIRITAEKAIRHTILDNGIIYDTLFRKHDSN
ncbi:hypothetical protein CSQ85_05320 [Bifidobacterium rousetti]|nr:hypothetical protein CSQ85_05320 [Bifidobacterium rousetti]